MFIAKCVAVGKWGSITNCFLHNSLFSFHLLCNHFIFTYKQKTATQKQKTFLTLHLKGYKLPDISCVVENRWVYEVRFKENNLFYFQRRWAFCSPLGHCSAILAIIQNRVFFFLFFSFFFFFSFFLNLYRNGMPVL